MTKKTALPYSIPELDHIQLILDNNPALKQKVLYRIRELKLNMGGGKKTYSMQEQKEIRLQQQRELNKKKI